MKPVSTGTGLIVLSATIAACFAASHFGGEERAFAQGVQQANTATPEANTAALMSGCTSQSESWFSPTPKRLYRCINPIADSSSPNYSGKVGVFPLGVCDVNGDGTNEFFDNVGDIAVFQWSVGSRNYPVLLRSVSEPFVNSANLLIHTPIISGSEALTAALRALEPSVNMTDGSIQPIGWRDIDHDGDQDLVCVFTYRGWGSVETPRMDIWFENTGYQATPPPNPYDHDGDGHVNTADLSLMLMEFTD